MSIKEQTKQLINILNKNIFEKEKPIKLTLLASLAGESIFLLGPPGVAKSLISNRVTKIFKDGIAFNYLMSKFSTPEEIYGPVSIKKLKDEDKYERKIEDYLPTADIAFLDEIWKSSPAIQNTLLTAINEKIMINGGNKIDLKLKSVISASNELPPTDEGLEALWDRFIIRTFVDNINNKDSFLEFLDDETQIDIDKELNPYKIADKDYKHYLKYIEQRTLSFEAKNAIKHLRKLIIEHNNSVTNESEKIHISDRRWKKIIQVLKTSAFYNDNGKISLIDLHLIINMIWEHPKQINLCKEFVLNAIKNTTFGIYDNLKTGNKSLYNLNNDARHLSITCNDVNKFITGDISRSNLKRVLLLDISRVKSQVLNLKKIVEEEKTKFCDFHLRENIFLMDEEFNITKEVMLESYYQKINDINIVINSLAETKGVVDGY